MRERFLPSIVLVSSLTFLVSLYLAWYTPVAQPGSGWDSFGQIAGLLALGLVALALVATINPGRTNLPLGATAVALAVFALLTVSVLWTPAVVRSGFPGEPAAHLRLGAYVGVAAAGLACLAAAALRWRELARRRSIVGAMGQAVALALLTSFMVPALSLSVPQSYSEAQALFFPDELVCLATVFVLVTWSRERQPGLRLASAAAMASLVVPAYLSPAPHPYSAWPYELWMLVAGTLALVALGLGDVQSFPIARPSASEVVAVLAAVLVLVSLFLPWKADCPRGVCDSARAWSLQEGYVAGALVTLLLVAAVVRRRLYPELAIGAALYVMASGLRLSFLTTDAAGDAGFRALGYGAFLGFVGGGLLLLATLRNLRPIPAKRLLVAAVPIAACVGLLSFAVGGRTFWYSSTFVRESPWLSLMFLSAATIVIALRLLLCWAEGSAASQEVVALPLLLLAVTVLDLVYLGGGYAMDGISVSRISWEGWVSVFLCLLLSSCGWLARNGGLRRVRLPGEIATASGSQPPADGRASVT